MNEFAINWIKGADYAEITVPSGTALKSKLLKLAEEKPDEVNHVVINKDGSMVCHAPVSYIHVSPKRKVSEKQKLAAKERFQKMWAEKKESLMNRKRNFWMRSWIPWMTNRWKKMIDIWQDGVRVYVLPDDNFCLADNEHRSPGHPYCTGDCFYYSEDPEERIAKGEEHWDLE